MFRRRRRRERFYLIGVPGYPNFGDDAIARGWLRWLAKHRPDAEVFVDTHSPSGAAALHHDCHPRVVFVDTLHRLAGWERSGTPQERVEATELLLDDLSMNPRWVAGVEAFHAADRVHLMGGGYLTGAAPIFSGLVGAARWAHRRRGARVAATGLGMMPMSDELAALWRESADAFEVLTVRDEPTREALGQLAELAPDDIFLGGLDQHVAPPAPGPETIVLAQGDGHDDFDVLTEQVARLLEAWDVTDRLRFVEANPPVDHRIYAALQERWPAATFLPFSNVMREGLPVGPHQQWITTRYHPHLLAAAHGARGVALSVSEDYYDVKHAAVQAWGSAWPVLGLSDDPVAPGSAGTLATRAPEHTKRLERIAARIYR